MPRFFTRHNIESLRILPITLLLGGMLLGVFPYLGFVNKTLCYPGYERALDLLFDQPQWMFQVWISGLAAVPVAGVLLALLRTQQTSTSEGTAPNNGGIEKLPQGFGDSLLGSAFEWIVALFGILLPCAWVVGCFMMSGTLHGRDSYVHVQAAEAANCAVDLNDFALRNGRHEFIRKDYRLMVDVESAYAALSERYPNCSRLVRDYGRRNAIAEAKHASWNASTLERVAARYHPRFMVDGIAMSEAIKAAGGRVS